MVIAIIAILAALLLPVLSRAKSRSSTTACLSNLRQLGLCWQMYAVDNHDALVPNNSVGGTITVSGASWCLADPTEADVQNGMLWMYNASLGIYHCPADRSKLTYDQDGKFDRLGGASGSAPGPLRARSYNMSMSVNGYPDFDTNISANIPMFTKLTEIADPGPVNCLVFIDEHEYTLMDSQFGMPTAAFPGDPPTPFEWWDMPANRHNQAANRSFADGHAATQKWKVPKTYVSWPSPVVPLDERPDWRRMEDCIKQTK